MTTGDIPAVTEDEAVLMAVQAMAGLVGPDWDAVTVGIDGDTVVLRVWVDDVDAAAEDMEDLVGELDVLAIAHRLRVRHEPNAGSPRPYRHAEHGRLVYLRRLAEDTPAARPARRPAPDG